MTVGRKIVENALLTIKEAAEVQCDLEVLEKQGTWTDPGWAEELMKFFKIPACTDDTVVLLAWRAVAKAYWESLC